MVYWLGVVICCFVYLLAFAFLIVIKVKKQEITSKTKNLVNIVLISVTMLSYLTTLLIYFYGADDLYNFYHGLPLANISPFLFTFSFFIYVLRPSLSKLLKSIYSFLAIGLFVAMIALPIISHFINGVEHFMTESIFDCISHGCSSLLGVWFIISNQVELKIKSLLKSLATIYLTVLSMIILNLSFKQNFFGMSPLENWNIYNFISFNSYALTLLTYLACIAVIMIINYAIYKGVYKLLNIIQKKYCKIN